MNATGTAVRVEGLVKSFGPVRALDGASLSVGTGEIYGLLGPNGAGKTTLIRSLVGLVAGDRGSVEVLGRRLPDRAVLAEIGYMPQSPALYADLTVEENVRFFAAIHGLEGGRARPQVAEALQLVDLSARRRSVVATLSGGMRQRVSLACALVHRPRLLLLDEPTVGVDPQLRAELWQRFAEMSARGRHHRRLQPRDGRGRALPAAGPAPLRTPARRGQRRRAAPAGRRHAARGRLPRPLGGRSVSLLRTAAIARRILQGFRHDRRTLVLLFVAPLIILGLFYFLIRGGSEVPSVDVVNLDQGGLGDRPRLPSPGIGRRSRSA